MVLPRDKPIKSLDTRTIRIKYDFFGKIEPNFNWSFFSFPKYAFRGRAGDYPHSIYIKYPAELQLKVITAETVAYKKGTLISIIMIIISLLIT
jgi:hypothetical protein